MNLDFSKPTPVGLYQARGGQNAELDKPLLQGYDFVDSFCLV
jgi:hypothetical protein